MTAPGSTSTEYNTNCTSIRIGTGITAVRNRIKEFNYTNTLVFNNVNVKRLGNSIASGTDTVRFVGTVVDGVSFDRAGSMVFNGNDTYIVTLDNGTVFTFSLR